MRQINRYQLEYTGVSASFNSDWLECSEGATVQVFINYKNIVVAAAPSITVKAQETPPARGGYPEGTAVDVPTAKIVEGSYPAARSTDGLDTFTLRHIGMWMRIAFTLADITSVDIEITVIVKD